MTIADMLVGYTVNGARQLRMEKEIGVIAPGKQADLVAVERDLFQELPHRIHAVPAVLAMSAASFLRANVNEKNSRCPPRNPLSFP